MSTNGTRYVEPAEAGFSMPSVAIVTPWLEHRDLWPDYLAVIADAKPDELWIVDNGSEPPLEFATYRSEDNAGFSGGSNLGLVAATTDVVVFLNNDVALETPGWLPRLLADLELGVLVGASLRSDPHAWVDGQVLPYLDGWCLAGMREDLLELGGWDESLQEPSYYSDNLLSLEARAHGFTLVEALGVGLTHKRSQTEHPDRAAATVTNRLRYQARARDLLTPAVT